MSRLIIKGLPGRFEDKQLRELFSPIGEVTDARVIKTQDGRSRRFGFVGFRTKGDAVRARSALNRSYVQTCPVQVEFAHSKGDEAIPRPWSKYSTGSSHFERLNSKPDDDNRDKSAVGKRDPDSKAGRKDGNSRAVAKDEKGRADHQLEEFLEVTVRKKDKGGLHTEPGTKKEKKVLVKSRKIGAEGILVERKHVTFEGSDPEKSNSDDDDDDDLYEEAPVHLKQLKSNETPNEATGNAVALNNQVSDMDYFKTKITKDVESGDVGSTTTDHSLENDDTPDVIVNDRSSGKAGNDTEGGDENETAAIGKREHPESAETPAEKWRATVHKGSEVVDAGETGRLLVRNLAFSVTEEELETTFEPFGSLSDVHIVRDNATGKSRGMGFVQFSFPEDAAKSLGALDRSFLSGRILHVLPARPKPVSQMTGLRREQNAGFSSFKSAREEARKESAKSGTDAASQHALHLASNAVANVAAERHGVSKTDLLGTGHGESGTAAVRMAIAEATIQGETKAFLRQHGVNIGVALSVAEDQHASTTAAKRKRMSRTAFLVKNLPAQTSERDVEQAFTKYGTILRLVVVPSGILAVVQFSTASDARRAYNGMAYTKFKDSLLYLEWLPIEALAEVDTHQDSEAVGPESTRVEKANGIGAVHGDDQRESEGRSVYVKNLSFETSEEDFKNHFFNVLKKRPRVARSLRAATIAVKRGVEGKEGASLSAGFGFLEFSSHEDAIEAVKIAQNSSLDGHELRLQISQRRNDAEKGTKRKRSEKKAKAGPKLMVRNIAFEATRKDIRQLFSTFGELKTVRMPKKVDGSHRGFAFVEFASKTEAGEAMQALLSSHLYGRHLVIEYAEDSGGAAASMAELEEKAAAQVAKKKRRVEVSEEGGEEKTAAEEKDETAMMRDALYG